MRIFEEITLNSYVFSRDLLLGTATGCSSTVPAHYLTPLGGQSSRLNPELVGIAPRKELNLRRKGQHH
jgi:hypothetical protein